MTGLGPAIAGTSQSPAVTLFDTYGNLATNYLGTVHFASTDSQASLPANYAFTAADGGSHTFAGLVVLKTAQSTTVSATDTSSASVKASVTVTITPGPPVKISQTLQDSANVFANNDNPSGLSCNFLAVDAYNNPDNISVQYSSSDPRATVDGNTMPVTFGALPPNAVAFTTCGFLTAGPQSLTIQSTAYPAVFKTVTINVLGPTAAAEQISMLSPSAQSGVTGYTLDPAANDRDGSSIQPNPNLVGLDQFTYTLNGTTYQLGVASIVKDPTKLAYSKVAWELNPPAGTVTPANGATLATCTPDGSATGTAVAGCNIPAPITSNYIVDDGFGNRNSNTITVQISAPPPPVPLPSGNIPLVGVQGFVLPGGVIGTDLTFTLTGPAPSVDPTTNVATIPFTSHTQCPNGTNLCTVSATASLYMPTGVLNGSGTLTSLDLSQPLNVVSPVRNQSFASVTVLSSPSLPGTNTPLYLVGESSLFNIAPNGGLCSTPQGLPMNCISNPGIFGGLASLQIGEPIGQAKTTVLNALYKPQSLCVPPLGQYAGLPTDILSNFVLPASNAPAGSIVILAFFSNSCPTDW
jgi:hypothetical protein